MEGSSAHLSKPTSSQSLDSLTTSLADSRSLAQQWPYDEDVISRNSHEEQEQLRREDLMAFQTRLREVGTNNSPRDLNWVPFVGTILGCTAISACHWMPGVRNNRSVVLRSLSSPCAFTLSLAALVLTVVFGVKHIYNKNRTGAGQLSSDTLMLFHLDRDKKGELISRNAT